MEARSVDLDRRQGGVLVEGAGHEFAGRVGICKVAAGDRACGGTSLKVDLDAKPAFIARASIFRFFDSGWPSRR